MFSLLSVPLLHSTHQFIIRFGAGDGSGERVINSITASKLDLQAQRRQEQHLLASYSFQGLQSRGDAK